jgi:sulfoxide reductase catalytic subunit YedY
MIIRTQAPIPSSQITPEAVYLNRRQFLQGAAAATAGAVLAAAPGSPLIAPVEAQEALANVGKSSLSTNEKWNALEEITGYNNFYEFGTDKEDPARNAGRLRVRPWTVKVEGHVAKPGDYAIDDLLKQFPLEERVYRLRALQWPYVEGLRLDEAQHPLTILAVGLYGKTLPNQNGAPIRLVVPWKYGFKSIKSIVKIKLVEKQPATSWNIANSAEYGFYSNVNPQVDHPRWSQARERRLGEFQKRATLMFNGYGDQVASLYTGLDLKKNY